MKLAIQKSDTGTSVYINDHRVAGASPSYPPGAVAKGNTPPATTLHVSADALRHVLALHDAENGTPQEHPREGCDLPHAHDCLTSIIVCEFYERVCVPSLSPDQLDSVRTVIQQLGATRGDLPNNILDVLDGNLEKAK